MGDVNKQLDRDTAKLKGGRKGGGRGEGEMGGAEYPNKQNQNTPTEQAKSVDRTSKVSQNSPTEQAKSVRIPWQKKQNQSKIWTESSLRFFSLSLSLCCEREVKRSRDETAVASKKAET